MHYVHHIYRKGSESRVCKQDAVNFEFLLSLMASGSLTSRILLPSMTCHMIYIFLKTQQELTLTYNVADYSNIFKRLFAEPRTRKVGCKLMASKLSRVLKDHEFAATTMRLWPRWCRGSWSEVLTFFFVGVSSNVTLCSFWRNPLCTVPCWKR